MSTEYTTPWDDREEQFHMMLFAWRDGLGATFEEANAKALSEGGVAVWEELTYYEGEVILVIGTVLGEGYTRADREPLTTHQEDIVRASESLLKALEHYGAPFGPLMVCPISVSRPFTMAEA